MGGRDWGLVMRCCERHAIGGLAPSRLPPAGCRRRQAPRPPPHPPPHPTPQELTLAVQLLDEAAQRLRQSADFLRGSDEPFLALGDVLLERGEQLAARGDAAGAAASLRAALDEGYAQAQRISANSPEAAVGAADVHMQLARLAGGAGRADEAAAAWEAACAGYEAALRQPEAFDFQERCDARYNHASCLARCGRAGEAAAVLRALCTLGATTPADVAADPDLAGVVL